MKNESKVMIKIYELSHAKMLFFISLLFAEAINLYSILHKLSIFKYLVYLYNFIHNINHGLLHGNL